VFIFIIDLILKLQTCVARKFCVHSVMFPSLTLWDLVFSCSLGLVCVYCILDSIVLLVH